MICLCTHIQYVCFMLKHLRCILCNNMRYLWQVFWQQASLQSVSGSAHVSCFVSVSYASVCALSFSGRSASPSYIAPQSFALSLSVSYGCVRHPSCFLIGCHRLLHWEGLLSQQHLNLGAGIFPLALVWKAERASKQGGWRESESVWEREGENKRTRVTDSWVQTVYMQLKKEPEEDGKGDRLFSSAFLLSLSLVLSFLSYGVGNALKRLSGKKNANSCLSYCVGSVTIKYALWSAWLKITVMLIPWFFLFMLYLKLIIRFFIISQSFQVDSDFYNTYMSIAKPVLVYECGCERVPDWLF